jgi:hypothetical protein
VCKVQRQKLYLTQIHFTHSISGLRITQAQDDAPVKIFERLAEKEPDALPGKNAACLIFRIPRHLFSVRPETSNFVRGQDANEAKKRSIPPCVTILRLSNAAIGRKGRFQMDTISAAVDNSEEIPLPEICLSSADYSDARS